MHHVYFSVPCSMSATPLAAKKRHMTLEQGHPLIFIDLNTVFSPISHLPAGAELGFRPLLITPVSSMNHVKYKKAIASRSLTRNRLLYVKIPQHFTILTSNIIFVLETAER